jgi:periplasmic glucans biosynthesis protein
VLSRYRSNLLALLAALVTSVAAGQEPTPAPASPPVAPRAVAPRVQPPKPVTPPKQQAAPEPEQKPAVQHPQATARPAEPFTFETVQKIAQDRASKPYRERSTTLPDVLAKLNYDQYRDIRFRRTSALWYDHAMFEVQFFHRGFQFDRRVNIFELVGNQVRAVPYNPAMFEFGKQVPPVKLPAELGFAGFRIHFPLNTPTYKDELLVFLGASYFRVLGRNELYGMSARGLAINTASEGGEEFPYFTDFWLVRPEPQQRSLTIYAVLDSPSVAGAYQFEVRPGSTTQVQVSGELYPRRAIEKIGIGALTSMYLYGENSNNGRRFDDFRPEVHDSDGLETQLGTGEWAWRPLVNPHQLRVNRFMDEHPRGFGLVQRDRDPTHYQDAEAYFHLRPSYWIEPLGDWGKGGVELVEIPTDEEIHDNIVAYWVPEAKVQPNKPIPFSYLLSAYSHSNARPPGGRVIATRTGGILAGPNGQALPNVRRMVVDFAGGDLDDLYAAQPVQAQISANGGEVDEITVQRLPQSATWRVAFKLKTTSEKPVDLRCYLTLYGEALTETWTYLWKSPGGA